MNTHDHQKLFSPVQIGAITLAHRVVMAPLTRSRSEQPGDIPGKLMLEYYTQRSSEGGLIISEATSISITGRGWFGAPGMYSDEQVAGWKKITSAVHAKGGRVFSQLVYAIGRDPRMRMCTSLFALCAQSGPDATFETPIRARSRSKTSR